MSDARWILAGLVVMFGAVGWTIAGGGEKGAATICLIAGTIMLRAIMRPVSASFVPEGGWLFWTGTVFVVAGLMAALWFQSLLWLSILAGVGAVLLFIPLLSQSE